MVFLWLGFATIAIMAGAAIPVLSTPYVLATLAAALIILVFLERSGDPMIPFLLLVATIQAGLLLQLPLGDGPVQSFAPFIGAWVIASLVMNGLPSRAKRQPRSRDAHWLRFALWVLAAIVVVTGLAQVWRINAQILNLTEILTLVQLGLLVAITTLLLTDAKKVLWVCYAAVASAVVVGSLGLASRFGVVSLSTSQTTFEGVERVSGFAGDPNKFAYLLLVPLAFALNMVFVSRSRRAKMLLWLATLLISGGIVSTYSAGALVGLAAVVTVTAFLQWRVSMARGLIAVGVIAVMAVTVALTVPSDYTEVVWEKYSRMSESSFGDVGTGRGAAWQAAVLTIADNPVWGSGLSTRATQTAIAANYHEELLSERAAHNTFLAIGTGTGVAGLAAFFVACVAALKVLWAAFSRAVANRRSDVILATSCILTALTVTLIQGLQLDLQMEKFPWLLLGAALAVGYWESPEDESLVQNET
jgi:O-antigen ligase